MIRSRTAEGQGSKYVLDTNLYIRAYRDPSTAGKLETFYKSHISRTYFSSVVAMELLAGMKDQRKARVIEGEYVGPFERTGRIITPSHRTWKRCAEVLSKLAAAGSQSDPLSGSFANDVLLSLSAAEAGATVITENTRDFRLIRTVAPIRFVDPWPV